MPPIFCTVCGAPSGPEDQFCTNCGHAFAEDAPPASPAASAPPPPPPLAPPPPVASAAPVAAAVSASTPPADGDRRRTTVIIGALVALLLVMGAVAVFALTRGDHGNEVVLEPAAVDVPDPFTSPVSIDEHPLEAAGTTTTTSTPGSSSSQATTTTTPPTGAAGGQVIGSAPGLYGGTRDAGSCDPDKLIGFLQGDAAKAKAWAEVQGIEPADIPAVVRTLTPVVLRRDTRVLNHGYRNGKATPRPAVLQAGTAVLVDSYGIPRVKCGCGNPLAVARPLTTGTTYSGTRWSGFDPAKVVVVRQDVKVETFVLVDVRTGKAFRRPTGSTGDHDAEATSGSTTTTTTTTAPATTTTQRSTTTLGASEGTSAPKLFSIESIAGVSNNPTAPSVAELPAARITAIFTYHWNNATGATPGTISLRSSTGKVYGPFQTTGSPGQGGVPNANWTAITNFTVPAGTYTVVDSSPETWAWAPDTGGRGMVIIYGVAQ